MRPGDNQDSYRFTVRSLNLRNDRTREIVLIMQNNPSENRSIRVKLDDVFEGAAGGGGV